MKITDVHILSVSPSVLQLSENGSPQWEWARSQDWLWGFLTSQLFISQENMVPMTSVSLRTLQTVGK